MVAARLGARLAARLGARPYGYSPCDEVVGVVAAALAIRRITAGQGAALRAGVASAPFVRAVPR